MGKFPSFGPLAHEKVEICASAFAEAEVAIPTRILNVAGSRSGEALIVCCTGLSGDEVATLQLDADARVSTLVAQLVRSLDTLWWKLRLLLPGSDLLLFGEDSSEADERLLTDVFALQRKEGRVDGSADRWSRAAG